MARRVSVDRTLFTVAVLLAFIGLVMVFSASAVMAKDRYGSPYTFLIRHAGWFSLQPSEIAKPALILFLAYFLESRTRLMDDWRNTLLPAVVPTVVFLGLIVK